MTLQHSLLLHKAIDNAISPNSAVKDPAISLVVTGKAKRSYTAFKTTNMQPQRLLKFVPSMLQASQVVQTYICRLVLLLNALIICLVTLPYMVLSNTVLPCMLPMDTCAFLPIRVAA